MEAKWNLMDTYQKVSFVTVFAVGALLLYPSIYAIMHKGNRNFRSFATFDAILGLILIGMNFAWIQDDL